MDDDMSLPLASLHPPRHEDVDPADAPRPDWVLLDFCAYFDGCTNATTASCKTRDEVNDIQVTFFPAQPPRVSHFCVHFPGSGPSSFFEEPKIIATDAKFVLLRIFIGHRYSILCPRWHDYYIYCADGGPDGSPSLQLLPHPGPYDFHDDQVGLISRGTNYTIAVLRDDSSALFRQPSDLGKYDVCLFHSEDKIWRAHPISVPYQEECSGDEHEGFLHQTTKVITVGGEHGTIAFVDLWRGILLYDAIRAIPMVRYIAMPERFCPTPHASPSITRDIAFVKGSIKFIQIVMKIKPGSARFFGNYISDGWVASKWNIKAPFHENSSWDEDCTLDASDINGGNNPAHLKLLEELPKDAGKPPVTLETLHIGHPILSLDNDDIVYFMAKVGQQDKKAWIIAVDMNHRMLQGVTEFGAERTFGFSYTYTQSWISKYLKMTPGTKGDLKRPGMPLPGFCNKKLSGISSAASVEAEDDDMM